MGIRSVTRGKPLARRLLRLGVDAGAALLALSGAFALRLHWPLPGTSGQLPPERAALLFESLPWALLLQVLSLLLLGLYESGPVLGRVELVRRIFWAVLLQVLAGASILFLGNFFYPRSVLPLYALFDSILLYFFRSWIELLEPVERRRVVLVGGGPAAHEVAREIRAHGLHGLEIAGFVPAPGDDCQSGTDPDLGPCLGTIGDLPRILLAGTAEDVLLVPGRPGWLTSVVDLLASTRPADCQVWLLPGPFESLIGKMRYRWVSDLPVIDVLGDRNWRRRFPGKRVFDLVVGSLLLLLALPVLLLAAAAIRLTSQGPILYRQRRVGLDLVEFDLWKLRTMEPDSEPEGDELLATPEDPRLTPVGGWLRRYRIDEIPQLFQVLAGSMSLIGPRPERPQRVAHFLESVPGYRERFTVPPGLTGLAQVNGDYHSSPENKLRYDLAYLASWSLWLDLSILWRTVRVVLTSRGV